MLRMFLSDPVNSLYLLLVAVMLVEALWPRGRGRAPGGRDVRLGVFRRRPSSGR